MTVHTPVNSASTSPENTPVLEARDLVKSYGEAEALKGVSFTAQAGEVICLLGANGAGKTTTLSIFLGLDPASGGQALVCGADVAKDPKAARKNIAYLPEVAALYPTLTGAENLQYLVALTQKTKISRQDAVAVLSTWGLPETAATARASTYSKGMRQRVSLASAGFRKAAALLLDEPLSGLDPAAARDVTAAIRKTANSGTAVLMATHDVLRAHDIADRVLILRQGILVESLTPSQIEASGLEALYVRHIRGAP